jgi:hypothetical protein
MFQILINKTKSSLNNESKMCKLKELLIKSVKRGNLLKEGLKIISEIELK